MASFDFAIGIVRILIRHWSEDQETPVIRPAFLFGLAVYG